MAAPAGAWPERVRTSTLHARQIPPALDPITPHPTHWHALRMLAQVIKHYLPEAAGKVHLVSNIHDVPAALEHAGAPCAARHGLLFVGNYNHKPNADAVAFLISHVLPRLR